MSQLKSSAKVRDWDAAIEDAKNMLKRVEARAQRLKVAIGLLEEKNECGDPYPGSDSYTVTQKAGTERASIPA